MADETTQTLVPNDAVVKNFNYKDPLAVAKVAKQMMADEGISNLDPTADTWGDAEENAWKGYCGKMGIHYTPFPELDLLPVEIRGRFEKAATEIDSVPQEPIKERPDFSHLMIDTIPIDKEGNITPIDDNTVKKRNTVEGINWSAVPGTMAQFDDKKVCASRQSSKHETVNPGAGSMIRQSKLAPQIHSRDKDGKSQQPTADMIEKFAHPDFDASRPSRNSQTEAQIVEAEEREEREKEETNNKGAGDSKLVVR